MSIISGYCDKLLWFIVAGFFFGCSLSRLIILVYLTTHRYNINSSDGTQLFVMGNKNEKWLKNSTFE